jgi:hypothetical protein
LSVQFIDVVNLPGWCDGELPGRFFNFSPAASVSELSAAQTVNADNEVREIWGGSRQHLSCPVTASIKPLLFLEFIFRRFLIVAITPD